MIKSRGCLFHLTLALVCAVITFMCYATVVMNANFAMTRTDEHAHVARIFVVPTLLALCGMVTFFSARRGVADQDANHTEAVRMATGNRARADSERTVP